jgi:hypothetical protein
MAETHLTAARLHELLSYDPATGIFTWRITCGSRAPAGRTAGSISATGYRYIKIAKHSYKAHRLAWLYANGAWPILQIDHINGNPLDNRLANLRNADASLNQQNQRKPRSDSTSGFLGVSWYKHHRKWAARIFLDGRLLHLGFFATAEKAHAAYLKAKRIHHEGCTI